MKLSLSHSPLLAAIYICKLRLKDGKNKGSMLITTDMHCNPRTAFLCDDIHIYVLQYSYMCFCLYITSMLFVKIRFYTLSKFILAMCAKFILLDAFSYNNLGSRRKD
jgi:hypothetical protein